MTDTKSSEDSGKMKLGSEEKAKFILLYIPIVLASVFGFLLSAVIGNLSVVLAGLGIISYILGLRHGVDVDHIAVIDNITRKLMQEGKKPISVGTWFSLGHSTIVVGLILALIVSTRAIIHSIPSLQHIGTLVGTVVSGTFLWFIGLVNLVIVFEIYGVYKELRTGKQNWRELEELLSNQGFLNRYFKPLFKVIRKPWQIYPVGVLFGLGFDTASEVALIAVSVGAGVSLGVTLLMILVLPLMFTCGMVLVDTTDGVMMRMAYGWSFGNPVRKIYYNLTMTVISIAVALVIGTIELLQVLSSELDLNGGVWNVIGSFNFDTVVIV